MADRGGVRSARGESLYVTAVSSRNHGSHLKKWLLLMYFWLRQFPVTTAALDVDISKSTAIDVYQWFREVYSTTLLNTQIVLGGNGAIVEIDESLFRHKPKVCISTIVYRCTNINILLVLAASPWASSSSSDMGIRNGRCFPHARPWVHGGGYITRCQHSSANNSSPHSSRHNHTL